VSDIHLFQVGCPHCVLGKALVEVKKQRGAHVVDTTPRQCDKCRKYFDVQVKMILKGVPLGPLDRDRSVRKALKNIVQGA